MCGVPRMCVCANILGRTSVAGVFIFSKFWPTNIFRLNFIAIRKHIFALKLPGFYNSCFTLLLFLFQTFHPSNFFFLLLACFFLSSLLLIPCSALRPSHYFSSLDSVFCLLSASPEWLVGGWGSCQGHTGSHQSWAFHGFTSGVFTLQHLVFGTKQKNKKTTDFDSCLPSTSPPDSSLMSFTH